jgi:hypothetical protein
MPTSSSPYPKVLVPSFPLFTNYLWTVVLFFVQCFILRHPSLLLLPAPDVHHCLPCPYSPSPRYSSWGKGAGAQQAGLPITPVPGKVGSAPRMLQQSVGGVPILTMKGIGTTSSPCWGWGGHLSQPGASLQFPICSYLNKKIILFWSSCVSGLEEKAVEAAPGKVPSAPLEEVNHNPSHKTFYLQIYTYEVLYIWLHHHENSTLLWIYAKAKSRWATESKIA